MADEITETRVTGFAQNIMASIKGVVVGLILFVGSFVVLWWNEGRIDLSELAKTSVPVNAEAVDTSANGRFISVTGEMENDQPIGDPWYLSPGPYIQLNRRVEMYAWVEQRSTKTEKSLGGKKKTTTTYSYSKEWTDDPEPSSRFHEKEGHENPSLSIKKEVFHSKEATIGAYHLIPRTAHLPRPSSVAITRDNFIPSVNGRLENGYIFSGKGTLQTPQIGDTRISFDAVMSGMPVTLFGKLNGKAVQPYIYDGDKNFYRAVEGSRESAIARLATEHRTTSWILRSVGFLMMWIGLCLFFGPINAVLDVVPILGGLGRSVIGLAMFAVALVLSLLTITVSIIAHNVLLLVITVAVLLFVVWGIRRLRTRPQPAPASPIPGTKASTPPPVAAPGGSEDEEDAMPLALQKNESEPPEKISFECEECGKRYTVKGSFAGRKGKCKKCGHKMYIPSESTI